MIELGRYRFIRHNGFARLRGRPTVHYIQEIVARHYDISPKDMTSEDKRKSVAHPRQVAMYLTRELTHKSYPDIANRFGGRDHTTVIHAVRAVERRAQEFGPLGDDLDALRQRLAG